MKAIKHTLALFLLLLALVSHASNRAFGQIPVPLTTANQNAVSVSLVTLISNPDRYEGKVVRVIGFVQLEFEGNAIYLHEEDFRRSVYENSLWLNLTPTQATQLRGYAAGGYAIVEGVFTSKQHGHMGMFSGEISKIDRLEPWLGR